MDSFSPLLERTRLPQPSLQKLAVISIFEKLRSAPPHLGPDSDPGRDAITQCLTSNSPAVVDQSVRELCRLVQDSKLELSHGLLELQSALEASDSHFVNVFIKAIGFLVRLGYQKNVSFFRFHSSETHPFVKIISCRTEVQSELVQQVLIFVMQNKHSGMGEVCEFLRPFLNFSIIRMSSSASLTSFVRNLLSSMASLCCSFPFDAIPVFKLLMVCFKYLPSNNAEDHTNISFLMEYTVDAYIVVLRHLVGAGLLIHEAQLCGVELLDIIISLHTNHPKRFGGDESIFEISRRLFFVQGELGLSYIPEFSSVMLSLFLRLIQSELEHVQLSILKLLLFLLKWKIEHQTVGGLYELNQELLFIFPVINLMSSTSKPVKEAATELLILLGKICTDFLVAPKNKLFIQQRFPYVCRPEYIIFRHLKHLWFEDKMSLSGSCYLRWVSGEENNVKEMQRLMETWSASVVRFCQRIVERHKSSLPISGSEEKFLNEMPSLLSAIASVLIVHPTLGNSAVDLLAVTGNIDPKLGVPLFLVLLFYCNLFSGKYEVVDFHNMLLKLLEMLPSLSSHPAMIPLIVQTILPMLQKDVKPVLYATAIRLLCKTWEINDRVFGSLQGVLLPKGFTQFTCERDICISMAVSIRDVCRRNPDRGVDLILSVEACIESKDPIIQALGFQSLAHLCEADVIDFYTAWDVMAKHVLNYSTNPIVAVSVCLLLRWGAMDAEVYPEATMNVVKILWEVGTSRFPGHGSLWANARASAFEALTHYEVLHLQQFIPDFRARNIEILISETDPEVLGAIVRFEVKMIAHEHITRRRLVKEKRVSVNKIEKLLDIFAQAIGSSGNSSKARAFPGAALCCLSFSAKDVNNLGASKVLQDLHVRYEDVFNEIAASLQLSRNLLIAFLSLQSWRPFMQRWLRARIMLLDTKASSVVLDRTVKAGNDILKRMIQIAEESIPRSAENIALAVGALCMVLPASAHAVRSTASKFLLNWLFQYEHEYRQWSAAISLGVISSYLHVTDHKQKFKNISALLEVVSNSKSTLVKGACGVGLGFSCQDLLTRIEAGSDSQLDKETYKIQEMDLLGKIIRTLCQLLSQFAESSSNVLRTLCAYFPGGTDLTDSDIPLKFSAENFDEFEEDIWGISGLVMGLGSSVTAIYRSGHPDAVLEIKNLIISWIPHANPLVQNSFISEKGEVMLSVGSCLVLPYIVAFCQRMELIDGAELDHLVNIYRELISELLAVKKSGTIRQSLLMASCVGLGNLLACILNEGMHSMDIKHVNDLLSLFKKTYSNHHPPLIHLGGMLGLVNALGAGAGSLFLRYPLTSTHTACDNKESSYIMGPLLSSAVMETSLTSSVQELFLVAQDSDDHQLQQYAAWAVSFLRHYLWSKSTSDSKFVSQSFAEDSVVMKLCLWLMHLNDPGKQAASKSNANTVATALRCLSQASRLPLLDWGAIIRRCMRYEDQVAERLELDSALKNESLRQECVIFSLAHANQFDSLLAFLDELSDLSRFRMLEVNLQSCILLHLPDLLKIFSGSRREKLFDDVATFIKFSVSSDKFYIPEKESTLRISCWKGICLCLDETSISSREDISYIENCIEVLFSLLPEGLNSKSISEGNEKYLEEWSEAVKCLGKARSGWLLEFLQISEVNLAEGGLQFSEAKKKIRAIARLVQNGSVPLIELRKLKAYILNSRSEAIWDVLVEVAAALQHAEGNVKRQWLVDAVEISCVTSYPSTALKFLGLLCGSFSKYMPLLTVDPLTVLSDLPVTLSSLLLNDTSWAVVAESIVTHLWTLTERIHDCLAPDAGAGYDSGQRSVDKFEVDIFLLQVMYHTCVALKDYLPPEKQLRLANISVPEVCSLLKLD